MPYIRVCTCIFDSNARLFWNLECFERETFWLASSFDWAAGTPASHPPVHHNAANEYAIMPVAVAVAVACSLLDQCCRANTQKYGMASVSFFHRMGLH